MTGMCAACAARDDIPRRHRFPEVSYARHAAASARRSGCAPTPDRCRGRLLSRHLLASPPGDGAEAARATSWRQRRGVTVPAQSASGTLAPNAGFSLPIGSGLITLGYPPCPHWVVRRRSLAVRVRTAFLEGPTGEVGFALATIGLRTLIVEYGDQGISLRAIDCSAERCLPHGAEGDAATALRPS